MSARRQLGLVSATALVVANMIGTGVFTTSGFSLAAMESRWWVLVAWGVGGILATLGALSYGALARRIPESGGEYTFLSRTVHPRAGHVAGWISLLVGFSAPLAMAAFALGEYTERWLPGLHPKITGTLALVLFSAIHAVHVQRGAWLQNVAVVLKLVLIAGFVGVAATELNPPADEPVSAFFLPTFAVSVMWISFSYSGWNAAVYVGSEVRDPERNLPRALLIGTGLVTVLYLALNAVFVFSAPFGELAGQLEIGQIAAESLGGPGWANAVTALVDLALLTSVSAMVMAGPRVYSRMAEDGYLPRSLVVRDGPPRAAITLQSTLALIMLWSATYQTLMSFVGFTLSLCTAATVFGLIRLRLKEGEELHVPGWPWVPCLFLLGVVAIAVLAIVEITLPALRGLFGIQ